MKVGKVYLFDTENNPNDNDVFKVHTISECIDIENDLIHLNDLYIFPDEPDDAAAWTLTKSDIHKFNVRELTAKEASIYII